MRILTVTLVLILASIGLFALAQPQVAAGEPAAAALDEDIGKHMSKINRTMRKVKRLLTDKANNAKNLENVALVQSEFLAVKLLVPGKVKKLEGAAKAKQLAVYRKLNIEVLEHLLALEKALLDDEMEKAKAEFGKVMALEEKGHDLFSD